MSMQNLALGGQVHEKSRGYGSCLWALRPRMKLIQYGYQARGDSSQGRADPERFLPGRIDHLGLHCDYRVQNFLLFLLGHFEVVERTADLRSNLVSTPRRAWRLWSIRECSGLWSSSSR